MELEWFDATTKIRTVAERDALLVRARKELPVSDYEDLVEMTLTSWALRQANRR